MKLNHTLKIFVLLFVWQFTNGQTAPESPSVSGMMRYGDYPVDYYTGMPNISVPLYSMPTRSSDITIGLGLSYHASTQCSYDEKMGNCGKGWTLSGGGAITRYIFAQPDEITMRHTGDIGLSTNDSYSFNFLGFSGKFIIQNNGDNLSVHITENEGESVSIDLEYDHDTFDIDKFIMYDTRGNRYIFGTDSYTDNYVHVYANPDYQSGIPNEIGPEIRTVCKTTYHILRIENSINSTLASFSYKKYTDFMDYHEGNEANYFYKLSKITVSGFGSIALNSYGTGIEDGYNDVVVSDYNNKIIKRFNFNYAGHSNPFPHRLLDVEETDENYTYSQKYKMEYKTSLISNQDIESTDDWGYYNNVNKWCNNVGDVDTDDLLRGVLEKLILPTGGVVYYNFEPNTFSFIGNKPLDRLKDSQDEWYDDPNFYTDITSSYFDGTGRSGAWNMHNYTRSLYSPASMTLDKNPSTPNPESKTFTILGGRTTLYFKFNAEQYEYESLQLGQPSTWLYPEFQLTGPGVSRTFKGTENYDNNENFCNGTKITLGNGIYTLKIIGNNSEASGSVHAYTLIQVPSNDIKKYWYGGGIRIKEIAYFKDYPANIYTAVPERKIEFDYSLPEDSQKSSGSLVRSHTATAYLWVKNYAPVTYKNVAVYDSQTGGRTEYVYYSPIDYEIALFNPIADSRLGKLQVKKVYDGSGDLLQTTGYGYNMNELEFIGDPEEQHLAMNIGWIPLITANSKSYSGSNFVETTESYTYWGNSRQIRTATKTSAITGETLQTKYFYDTNNIPGYYNRSEPEIVEQYRNNELIATSKTTYQKDWPDPDIPAYTNHTYRPATIQSAKGSNPLETKTTINLYDYKGHALETEQENGIKTAYIWGYNNSQIIAKIENAGYADIISYIDNLKNLSDSDNDRTLNYTGAEGALRQALNNLRNIAALSNAMVTTYTYDPLIGVTSITGPDGNVIYYHYDEQNRLQFVKDKDGNVVEHNEYHIKTVN